MIELSVLQDFAITHHEMVSYARITKKNPIKDFTHETIIPTCNIFIATDEVFECVMQTLKRCHGYVTVCLEEVPCCGTLSDCWVVVKFGSGIVRKTPPLKCIEIYKTNRKWYIKFKLKVEKNDNKRIPCDSRKAKSKWTQVGFFD